MMKILRIFIGCALALSLSACASGITFTEMKPSLSPPTQEMGRIFFYRPITLGAAFTPDILVNGKNVGESVAWGFFHIDRPSGNYEVVTSTEVERKVSFVLEKGQTRYIRFSVNMGFFAAHVYGDLVDQATALPELEECRYAGQAQGGR